MIARAGLVLLLSLVGHVFDGVAQHMLEVRIADAESRSPLPGASAILRGTSIANRADADGIVRLDGIPAGTYSLTVSFVGYERKTVSVVIPSADPIEVFLESERGELEEIVVSSTRGSRTFADIPTRIEFIAGEELDEKSNMKAGDIRMLLNESTGIQTQQTSATTANASIRIQGLDGRYTQILRDGFPLYVGFSGGLGLLQTPPLDLKQVEVIKGSSSTLYGGGAIAGLVNLISKTPGEEQEMRLLANATSGGGLDLSAFYSNIFGKVGVTLFGSRNTNSAYDPADIDLTAIPEFNRTVVNPRLFFELGESTSMQVGVNVMREERIGGDIHVIEGKGDDVHRYFEKNDSERMSTQFSFTHRLNDSLSLTFRNSFNRFDRLLETPGYTFSGLQKSTFSEVNIVRFRERTEWIAGVNLWTDHFAERPADNRTLRDYRQNTFGMFVQNSLTFSEEWMLESGLRGDYVQDYGFSLLPRLALLYRPGTRFSSRIGGGFGYKAPTIFLEETERVLFEDVHPVSPDDNVLERSYGANWDLNFRTSIGEVDVNVNHLFFYTFVDRPLQLEQEPSGHRLINADGFVDTKGIETNIKAEWEKFKLFLGYTFTDARLHIGNFVERNPMTARSRLNNVLMYEVEDKWRLGLEAYYFGRQRLNDGSWGRDYWICGFMAERIWERFSIFINFENFTDARQTRFDTIYTGSISQPVFRDIYAPMDGFVVNGGIKINVFPREEE